MTQAYFTADENRGNCEIDENECTANLCKNGGTCHDLPGDFRYVAMTTSVEFYVPCTVDGDSVCISHVSVRALSCCRISDKITSGFHYVRHYYNSTIWAVIGDYRKFLSF